MSELIATTSGEIRSRNALLGLWWYRKFEVDKTIAELKAKLPRWRSVDECFPSADDGYFLVLWDDGLPDLGYIGAEDDVIETVRDLSDGHSVEWWMPLPSAPKEAK